MRIKLRSKEDIIIIEEKVITNTTNNLLNTRTKIITSNLHKSLRFNLRFYDNNSYTIIGILSESEFWIMGRNNKYYMNCK